MGPRIFLVSSRQFILDVNKQDILDKVFLNVGSFNEIHTHTHTHTYTHTHTHTHAHTHTHTHTHLPSIWAHSFQGAGSGGHSAERTKTKSPQEREVSGRLRCQPPSPLRAHTDPCPPI